MSERSLFLLKSLIRKFQLKWIGDLNKYIIIDHQGVYFSDNTQNAVLYYTKTEFCNALVEIEKEDKERASSWYDYSNKSINQLPPLTTNIFFTNLGVIPEEKHAAAIQATVIAYDYNNNLVVFTGEGKLYRLGANIPIMPLDYKEPDVAVAYIIDIGINYEQASKAEKEHLLRLYMAGLLKGQ